MNWQVDEQQFAENCKWRNYQVDKMARWLNVELTKQPSASLTIDCSPHGKIYEKLYVSCSVNNWTILIYFLL
jgi:hypothetical protein